MTRRRARRRSAPEVIDLPRAGAALAGLAALAREHPELTGLPSPENAAAWESALALDETGDDIGTRSR